MLAIVTSDFPPSLTRSSLPSRKSPNSFVFFTDSITQAVGTSTSNGWAVGSITFMDFVFHAVTAGRTWPLTAQAAPLLQIV